MTDHLTENARLRAALERIGELNMLPPDENGHRWWSSDLIGQEAAAALATPAPDPLGAWLWCGIDLARDGDTHVEGYIKDGVFHETKRVNAPAPDAVQEAAIDVDAIENGGKRWHGEDHRVVSVRWEPYKPDGQRQMKAKGRWQEQVGSGDYWRWQNCDRPAALAAPAPDAVQEAARVLLDDEGRALPRLVEIAEAQWDAGSSMSRCIGAALRAIAESEASHDRT